MKEKIKMIVTAATIIILIVLVSIGVRWYFFNQSFSTKENIEEIEKDATLQEDTNGKEPSIEEVDPEDMDKEDTPGEEQEADSSEEISMVGDSITLDELFQNAPNHKSKKDKVAEDKNGLSNKKLNISGKGLEEEIEKSTKNDIYLTNKNDTLNNKEMKESNKIKAEENRSDKNENKVEDNTPSFDAEPEQKTPIVWEDGGEPAKKGEQQTSSGVSSGESTNGGYLN